MYPKPIQDVINEFAKLPGIGPRTAGRFAFNLLRRSDFDSELLSHAIAKLKKDIKICKNCFNISENDFCEFCIDSKRDNSIICVIEEAMNIPSIEKTNKFKGLYHVLGGSIKPNEGISPEKLHIKELVKRINQAEIREIIIATNPNSEGETTALYLLNVLKNFKVKITRLARGLSTGSDLEYVDQATIGNALTQRVEYK
ncbi:recombination mediator RecR [Patescibacteria group bacterium]|nr:recombination mediator RecR [Patescibacteria group bacterium]